jgi:hypothetical protein
MSAEKSHASPMVGMNSIAISEILSSTFEETYNELLNYVDILEPLLEKFEYMRIEEKENNVEEKEVEEVKMLSDNIKEPLLDLNKCSLNELINILQSFANDPSFNVHNTGFGSCDDLKFGTNSKCPLYNPSQSQNHCCDLHNVVDITVININSK